MLLKHAPEKVFSRDSKTPTETLKSFREVSEIILNPREAFSLDSISCLMMICSKFFPKPRKWKMSDLILEKYSKT